MLEDSPGQLVSFCDARPVATSVGRPQEPRDGTVGDPAAVTNAFFDSMPEMDADQDAREAVLVRGLREARNQCALETDRCRCRQLS
jgi:hypothetical protein